jgi:hypothetical protein
MCWIILRAAGCQSVAQPMIVSRCRLRLFETRADANFRRYLAEVEPTWRNFLQKDKEAPMNQAFQGSGRHRFVDRDSGAAAGRHLQQPGLSCCYGRVYGNDCRSGRRGLRTESGGIAGARLLSAPRAVRHLNQSSPNSFYAVGSGRSDLERRNFVFVASQPNWAGRSIDQSKGEHS